MLSLQSCKVESLLDPGATIATSATAVGYIDTLGWDEAKILVQFGATHATTTVTATACALSEGTNSAAATAIVAFTGGTVTSASVGYVIAKAENTVNGSVIAFNVNLIDRERYLKVSVTPAVADYVGILAILARGHVMPGSDDGSVANNVTG